jgi:hypothetical protein
MFLFIRKMRANHSRQCRRDARTAISPQLQRKDETMSVTIKRMLCVASLFLAATTCRECMTCADEPSRKPAETAAGESAKTPKIEIALDTSDAPEMADWAEQAKKTCEDSYPMIVGLLGEEGFKPPEKTKIVFKHMDGVAHTAGGTITCSAEWFTDHADDVGAVIHELCHVVQRYRAKQPPGWVTEGVADYVRWFNFEPESRHPQVRNPRKAKYTDSYQTTAAFFDWIVKNKDPQFVTRLNVAARRGEYKSELFKEYAGKPLDELWTEFVQSQKPSK